MSSEDVVHKVVSNTFNPSWIFIKGIAFGIGATLLLEWLAVWLFGFFLSGGHL